MSGLTIISGNFTSQERQRVLGQSGNAVFEKHYQSQFIGRDLQHVVSSSTVSGRSITRRWKHAQEKGSISTVRSYRCAQACYLPTP